MQENKNIRNAYATYTSGKLASRGDPGYPNGSGERQREAGEI